MVHRNRRHHGVKRATVERHPADVALMQIGPGASPGKLGACASQHLSRQVVAHDPALGKTVEQFLRQIPGAKAEFQHAKGRLR